MADLFSLPDIQFVEVNADKITSEIITSYESLADRTLYPGDPIRLFLTGLAQIIVQQRVLINETGKQNLLRYANGDVLDHIGVTSNVPRLEQTAARTTQQFFLSTSLASTKLIPAGTRVGPQNGGTLYFETAEALEIPAGALSGTVEVICTTSGVIGNGFLPGQINILIDPIPFVQNVTNITTSSGGADREADDAYRERIHISPESYSTAGPEGAYRFFATSASPLIVDVSVRSPSDGVVEIRPLLQNGEIPGEEILNLVLEACNDRSVRPLTDHVQVIAPEQVGYDLNVTYWISTDNSSMAASIQSAVGKAVDSYKAWQSSKLGRSIDPSELIARVKNAGAKRVTVTSPSFSDIEEHQVAKVNTETVAFGGLEDD
ncbi:baseplate J/gp47 family protein [Brevibacillus nitrificans]|uniref:baseplate assembly protein n=1 Tax=Brevibacillus nitrificans TaxID=651560 RepID=UPI00285A34A6|nr:baseplate J/gp47 family protein [Brevibacillus nitrificans]MDR7318924.1 phage-related baseplate assembly protein [Brevibacillus nitrificans]